MRGFCGRGAASRPVLASIWAKSPSRVISTRRSSRAVAITLASSAEAIWRSRTCTASWPKALNPSDKRHERLLSTRTATRSALAKRPVPAVSPLHEGAPRECLEPRDPDRARGSLPCSGRSRPFARLCARGCGANAVYRGVRRTWRYWLNRRGGKRRMTWPRFVAILARHPLATALSLRIHRPEEPDAGNPHVRICGSPAEQSAGLP